MLEAGQPQEDYGSFSDAGGYAGAAVSGNILRQIFTRVGDQRRKLQTNAILNTAGKWVPFDSTQSWSFMFDCST